MWNPFTLKLNPNRSADEAARRHPESAAADTGRYEIAETEIIGPTAVVTLTVTELVGPEASERLTELLEGLQSGGATNLVLDVQNVQMMDSACLGSLVRAVKELDKGGGRMALVNADRSVQYLFKLTKLDRVFPICADVPAALAAVERPSHARH